MVLRDLPDGDGLRGGGHGGFDGNVAADAALQISPAGLFPAVGNDREPAAVEPAEILEPSARVPSGAVHRTEHHLALSVAHSLRQADQDFDDRCLVGIPVPAHLCDSPDALPDPVPHRRDVRKTLWCLVLKKVYKKE